MSLQLAAQHLSSQGRGNDSTLIHMSPREVDSLNAIAKAHGGQLTTNPSTGLPEAGFLESILPMVAGAGLMMIPGMQPMGAAAITGGLSFAMTGSLQKGLMAGLGAYGGAGLGAGLTASGVDAAAATDTASKAAQTQIAENAANTKFYNPAGGLDPAMKSQYIDAQLAAQNQAMAARKALEPTGFMDKIQMMGKGIGSLGQEGGISNLYQNLGGSPMSLISKVGSAAAPAIGEMMTPKKQEEEKADADMGQRYGFSMNPTGGQQTQQPQQAQPGQNPLSNTPTPTATPFPQPDPYGREQRYFSPSYSKLTPESAKSLYGYADGGAIAPEDRPTETPAVQMFQQMQAQRAAQPQAPQVDVNAQYADYLKQTMGTPNQMQAPTAPPPTSTNLAESGYSYDPIKQQYGQMQGSAAGMPMSGGSGGSGLSDADMEGFGNAATSTTKKIGADIKQLRLATGGGISHLGDYSDGGRLLRGPGDGVSDSIPAMIGKKQPARLADGEFVVPARIVSELGNGSTEAGARKLYAMMDRIQKARGKTVGKGKVAKNSRSEKYLPA
jgi:hypothetical protein